MEVIRKFVLFLLMLAVASDTLSEEAIDLSKLICDMPACSMVAKQGDFSGEKLERSIILRSGAFFLEIPDEPLAKMVVSGSEIIFYYKDGQRLLIGEDSGPDVGRLVDLSVNQLPEIVFSKTIRDREPTALTDRLFWKVSLYQKPAYFNNARETLRTENNGISYFLSDSDEMGFSGSAMISASTIKDRFLRVKAMYMEYAKLRKIVYSTTIGK